MCGGCLDFKVVTALDADAFGAWEEGKFAPEEKFLEKIKAIDGVTQVCQCQLDESLRKSTRIVCGALPDMTVWSSFAIAGGDTDLHPDAYVEALPFEGAWDGAWRGAE